MAAPAIGRRSRWAPKRASIDWSHPLSQGLLGYGLGGNLIYPSNAALDGSNGVAATPYGQASTVSAAQQKVAIGTLPANTDSTGFTFFALAYTTTTSGNGPLIGYRYGGGPGTTFAKLYFVESGVDGRTGLGYYSNDNYRTFIHDGAPFLGVPVHVVGVKNGLTMRLYRDGIQVNTQTSTSGQLDQNAATVFYGGDENRSGGMVAGAVWTRALSAAEVAALYADPFRMLR